MKRLLLGVAMLATGVASVHTSSLEELSRFPRGTVEIVSSQARHRFDVWVADTPARQAQGLMFVTELAADRGMVFPRDPPRPASMWMKNTYVELDMLFIVRGRIAHIAARTRPHSLETIEVSSPVSAVIEIRGGEAERRGLAVGDRVRIELSNDTATKPG